MKSAVCELRSRLCAGLFVCWSLKPDIFCHGPSLRVEKSAVRWVSMSVATHNSAPGCASSSPNLLPHFGIAVAGFLSFGFSIWVALLLGIPAVVMFRWIMDFFAAVPVRMTNRKVYETVAKAQLPVRQRRRAERPTRTPHLQPPATSVS